ncbi:ABC transportersubstrate-binding component [Bordetella ansorpii]|uniref:ABC transportersubstrate-binding component n=1 Tax=Bordetella ansorpii TaxID=288768 RepID=A0A157LL56_9BORD|nr:ABC transporter substrate-binding protein [Bordetella ansorpii]SAH97216.1 ABC transportersubstrate-binding component [Bordetella ansorpii]
MRISAVVAAVAVAFAVGAAQAQDVVRLGVSNDRSGIYADLGGLGSEMAVRMAVEDFDGKVAGKTVEVIGADNQNKADVASSLVRRWFDTQGVVAVVDGGASSAGLAAQGVAREKGGAALISGGFAGDFSGKQCSELSTQWAPDTYALANAVVRSVVDQGGKSWYFITTDYVFGKSMEANASRFVQTAGGKVLGSTRHPLGALDFASFLLQAQSSGADVVGLASAGGDLVNLIKQAQEFGLTGGQQRLMTFLTFINDVQAMGLPVAQGLTFPTGFYWDADEDTRAWTRRWQQKVGTTRPPSIVQALSYVSTVHYLQAAQAAGTFDGAAVNRKMRERPITTRLIKNARVRPEDGRVIMDMYLVEVKKPAESKYANDFYRILSTVPGEKVFVSLAESECPSVKK